MDYDPCNRKLTPEKQLEALYEKLNNSEFVYQDEVVDILIANGYSLEATEAYYDSI